MRRLISRRVGEMSDRTEGGNVGGHHLRFAALSKAGSGLPHDHSSPPRLLRLAFFCRSRRRRSAKGARRPPAEEAEGPDGRRRRRQGRRTDGVRVREAVACPIRGRRRHALRLRGSLRKDRGDRGGTSGAGRGRSRGDAPAVCRSRGADEGRSRRSADFGRRFGAASCAACRHDAFRRGRRQRGAAGLGRADRGDEHREEAPFDGQGWAAGRRRAPRKSRIAGRLRHSRRQPRAGRLGADRARHFDPAGRARHRRGMAAEAAACRDPAPQLTRRRRTAPRAIRALPATK